MGSMLSASVPFTNDPILYLELAFKATFFTGLFQAYLGFLRLVFPIDFLSKTTLIGFMAGAAVIVSLQQLKGSLGIVHFTTSMQFWPIMSSVIKYVFLLVWGVAFLLVLLMVRHISLKRPKLFWVSAVAPLTRSSSQPSLPSFSDQRLMASRLSDTCRRV